MDKHRLTRQPKPGASFAWKRWRASRMTHYRLWDRRRVPEQQVDCLFPRGTSRKLMADHLRKVRRGMRFDAGK